MQLRMARSMFVVFVLTVLFGPSVDLVAGQSADGPRPSTTDQSAVEETASLRETIAALKSLLEKQQAQIDKLTTALEEHHIIEASEPNPAQIASLKPTIPSTAVKSSLVTAAPLKETTTLEPTSPTPNDAIEQDLQQYTKTVDELTKKVETTASNIAGFKLSGDFRFRADAQVRSGNDIAGPLQNVRSRYRVRLNADKDVDPRFKFHLQLSTGPANVGTTNDQDMAGLTAKPTFSIAEAYVDFHPTSKFSLRGGRMEEVFADNMRFIWDDDVRFNGFQQVFTIPFGANGAGFKSLEFRAGEYFLSNPNVTVLSSTSPFVAAGYQTGQKVRDSNLFHPGLILKQDLGNVWSHQFGADFQVYRNPNQIQLASTANGFPVLISNALGLALAAPLSASGNATTTAGGAIFTARNFNIARVSYRIQHKGILVGKREMPLYFDFQVARNTGTSFERDAAMGSVNFGTVRGSGDVRFLYQYAVKQANSLISQFTDDDLGTGTGVNIRVHAIRADVGITKFLQWQNLLFIQNEISPSDPTRLFFVPLQAGAKQTYRYLGQLAFTF